MWEKTKPDARFTDPDCDTDFTSNPISVVGS